ncbi:MOSC N-terminal beta barrel domain-containing protein [Pollutimonas bauzanensis]|uniref:MOSC N-terminal beta barrel domain-containing protein n=1 Tax=Pollutimonas bauzanensis TaxID=658167 RepID=A0A1M5ZKF4_9BURK|nr:MOSC N-terminal beta barrel domain-containing protein [Pollutimonas bauzanensis]SHI24720.1 MOSC N-terminal beta barrel domain-containing protein [Pollutimonas bauzanensis]
MISILYFPIAACGGIDKPDAAPYDKRWLVVDESGGWLSQARCGKLADIKVDISMGCLVMRAPGMLRLDIPLDVIEDDDSVRRQAVVGGQRVDVVDEGELVATWVSKFLGQPCRLVKVHPDAGPVFWP